MSERPRLGKLTPMYDFILNPHSETRVSTCPGCDQRMRQRKVPLFIHVNPMNPVVMGYTCRYCPDCDLLVAHQDEIESLLAALFAERDPSLIGNDYLVLGTMERQAWRENMKQPKSIPEILEHVHDFREVHTVQVQPGGWYPADMDPSELPIQEPDRLNTLWQAQRSRLDHPSGKRPQPPVTPNPQKSKRRRRRHRRK